MTRDFASAFLAEKLQTMPEKELLAIIEDALERDGLIAEHNRCAAADGFTGRPVEEFLAEMQAPSRRAARKLL